MTKSDRIVRFITVTKRKEKRRIQRTNNTGASMSLTIFVIGKCWLNKFT